MTEHLDPDEVARRSFELSRRGYDQQSVRAFLHEVSSLLERLQRAERELRERAERAEARAALVEHPDESTMLALLGEETTRVLTSAKEAAAEIRTKAEAAAERLVADATAEAGAIRSSAAHDAEATRASAHEESEALLARAGSELAVRSAEAEEVAARIREEGAAAAEELREQGRQALAAAREEAAAAIEAAKAEGKAMVAEAQAVRERVLRDLQVRRRKARVQVEMLNAGRERLLQAYDVVRRTVDEATDELNTALGDARVAADTAARRLDEEPETSLAELDVEIATAGLVDLPIAEVDQGDDESSGQLDGEISDGSASGPPGVPEAAAEGAAGAADQQRPSDGDPGEPFGADAAPVTAITSERRSRRARKRKGFDGLPAGELTRIEPPAGDEGVRILAESIPRPDEPPLEGAPDAEAQPEAAAGDAAQNLSVGEPASGGDEVQERDGSGAAGNVVVVEEPESASDGEASPAAVDSEADHVGGSVADEPEAQPDEAAADVGAPQSRAEDVFAKLRASQEGDDGAPAPGTEGSVATPSPTDSAAGEGDSGEGVEEVGSQAAADTGPERQVFAERDAAVEPLAKELSRRLKRTLADEQNEVLDLLRRAKPKGVDDLLPTAADHAARWAGASSGPLAEAAAAGASGAGGEAGSVEELAQELAQDLVGPLRDRIDRSFAASDGNLDDVADRVRALYREWKGKRMADTSSHFVAAAYARGAFEAIAEGAQVRWLVDPATAPCPDCDDNVLAGALAKGDDFPTGSPSAPAHPGCRCLVVPG